jgi:hypothetical protein
MPNLNEFINQNPNVDPRLEKIDEPKPCKDCMKDSDFYYWDTNNLEMTWTCPDGHKNSYRVS